MIVAYARVSDVGQSLDIQLATLAQAGAERVFSEKVSGSSRDGRAQLEEAIAFCREGDTLIVTRLDRFARSAKDALMLLEELDRKKVAFRCLQQPIDTSSSAGKMFLTMLAAVSEFELSLKRERQKEGIAKAKAEGRYGGRKGPRFDYALMKRMRIEGKGAAEIAKRCGCHRNTVYLALPGMWDDEPVAHRGGRPRKVAVQVTE